MPQKKDNKRRRSASLPPEGDATPRLLQENEQLRRDLKLCGESNVELRRENEALEREKEQAVTDMEDARHSRPQSMPVILATVVTDDHAEELDARQVCWRGVGGCWRGLFAGCWRGVV